MFFTATDEEREESGKFWLLAYAAEC